MMGMYRDDHVHTRRDAERNTFLRWFAQVARQLGSKEAATVIRWEGSFESQLTTIVLYWEGRKFTMAYDPQDPDCWGHITADTRRLMREHWERLHPARFDVRDIWRALRAAPSCDEAIYPCM